MQQDDLEDDQEDDRGLRPGPFPNLISTLLLDWAEVSAVGGRVHRRAPLGSADETRIQPSGQAAPRPQVGRVFAPPATRPVVYSMALDQRGKAAHRAGELQPPGLLRR